MSDFSDTELRRIDLTLLLVFIGLIRRRKARLVAAELGLTQSAISQALRRLRDVFGDELFLRRPHGMEPTATALALEAPIAAVIESLRAALGAARAFDPQKAEGIVRIAALDAEQAVLLPPLAARLRQSAPGLRLLALPLGRDAAIDALIDGRVDLCLGLIWDHPETVLNQILYEEDYLVAGARRALPKAPRIAMSAYCAADHILVSPGGDLHGIVDERLAAAGRSRRVIMALSAFLPALAASAATGALVTLPARVARAFAPGFRLVTAAPPMDIRQFPVSVAWHLRNKNDPRTVWIVEQLQAVSLTQKQSLANGSDRGAR